MTDQSLPRNRNAVTGDALYLFVLDDDHVRDNPFYRSYVVVTGVPLFGYSLGLAGGSIFNYNATTEQMDIAEPMNTGNYNANALSSSLVSDDTYYSSSTGCRDVFGQLRIVEILQNQDIAANVSLRRVYVKTSVNQQINADGDEVPTSFAIYDDNSNIPSYSENFSVSDFSAEGYNYQSVYDVNGSTDAGDIRVGPIKNFFVHDKSLDGVLSKSFSFEIAMNSEGTVYDTRVEIANRKELGNAS